MDCVNKVRYQKMYKVKKVLKLYCMSKNTIIITIHRGFHEKLYSWLLYQKMAHAFFKSDFMFLKLGKNKVKSAI